MPTLSQYPRNIQIRAINKLIEKYGHKGTLTTGAAPAEDCMVLFGKFKISFGNGNLIINNNYKLHVKPIGKLRFDTQPDPTSEVRVNGASLGVLNARKIAPDGANPIVWEMEAAGDEVPYDEEVVPPPTPVIVTPSVVAPTANQESYANTGTSNSKWAASFTSTAFATTGGADTFVGAEWQISVDNTFSTTVTSAIGQQGTTWDSGYVLNRNTDYYVRVRHTGTASGTSAWSTSHRFNLDAFYVAPPAVTTTAAKPSMVTPATAASDYPTVGNTGSLYSSSFTVSAFALASGSDSTYVSTEWQIATDAGFTTITTTGTTSGTSWTSGVVLAKATNYYVRARHLGTNSIVSEYSNAVLFNLGAEAAAIATPSITTATMNGSTGYIAPALANTSDFEFNPYGPWEIHPSLTDFSSSAGKTFANTKWQIAKDSAFTNIVWAGDSVGGYDSNPNETYSTSTLVMPNVYPLRDEVQYYMRGKYVATDGTQSEWSATVPFKIDTTRPAPVGTINAPTITTTINATSKYLATGSTRKRVINSLASYNIYPTASAMVSSSGSTAERTYWQISTSSTFASGMIYDGDSYGGTDTGASGLTLGPDRLLMHIPTGPFPLSDGVNYYMRVKWIADSNLESPWSPTYNFMCNPAATVVT